MRGRFNTRRRRSAGEVTGESGGGKKYREGQSLQWSDGTFASQQPIAQRWRFAKTTTHPPVCLRVYVNPIQVNDRSLQPFITFSIIFFSWNNPNRKKKTRRNADVGAHVADGAWRGLGHVSTRKAILLRSSHPLGSWASFWAVFFFNLVTAHRCCFDPFGWTHFLIRPDPQHFDRVPSRETVRALARYSIVLLFPALSWKVGRGALKEIHKNQTKPNCWIESKSNRTRNNRIIQTDSLIILGIYFNKSASTESQV